MSKARFLFSALFLFYFVYLPFRFPVDSFFVLVVFSWLWFGEKGGGGVGRLLGFCMDSWTGVLGVHSLSRFFLGYVSGLLRHYFVSPSFVFYEIWIAVSAFLIFFLEWGLLCFFMKGITPLLLGRGVVQFLFTFLAANVFYAVLPEKWRTAR